MKKLLTPLIEASVTFYCVFAATFGGTQAMAATRVATASTTTTVDAAASVSASTSVNTTAIDLSADYICGETFYHFGLGDPLANPSLINSFCPGALPAPSDPNYGVYLNSVEDGYQACPPIIDEGRLACKIWMPLIGCIAFYDRWGNNRYYC